MKAKEDTILDIKQEISWSCWLASEAFLYHLYPHLTSQLQAHFCVITGVFTVRDKAEHVYNWYGGSSKAPLATLASFLPITLCCSAFIWGLSLYLVSSSLALISWRLPLLRRENGEGSGSGKSGKQGELRGVWGKLSGCIVGEKNLFAMGGREELEELHVWVAL